MVRTRTTRRTRARRGDGSRPYRRADGRWVALLDLGWEDGKRRRKYVYGATEAEAADALVEARRKHRAGLDLSSDRLTVAEWLAEWLEVARPSLRPSTYDSYAMIVNHRIVPRLGPVKLIELRAPAINKFLRELSASGLSARSVQYTRAVLRRALNLALRQRLVERNEAALADPPKAARHEIVPLTPDEARAFLAHLAGEPGADPPVPPDRLHALYVLALATGMRQGEILGLRWQDVDLRAGTLRVRHALARVGGKLELTEPKTERSRRTITLPGIAAVALRDHRRVQLEERLVAGPAWVGDDDDKAYVFASRIGSPLDGSNVLHGFQAHLAVAGLPRRRFHDLRHSAATLLLVQGVSAVQVMKLLGHSNITLTLGTYTHLVPELERDAADRMDAILAPAQ